MKNFKNFELNNTQKLNTFGQGRPDFANRPEDADQPDFVDTLPDAGEENAIDAGNPSFTGKGKGRA